MDLTKNICECCCKVNSKENISLLSHQDELLQRLLPQDPSHVLHAPHIICNQCRLKLGQFRQFFQQWMININMLSIIRTEQKNNKNISEPDTPFLKKCENENPEDNNVSFGYLPKMSITITEINQDDVEMEKEQEKFIKTKIKELKTSKDEKRKEQKQRPVLKIDNTHLNKITIQETTNSNDLSPGDKARFLVEPDVSLVEEPAPPAISVINKAEVSLLKPVGGESHHQRYWIEQNQDGNGIMYMGSMSPDERRRCRNREASKRYRERARRDPELLKKMREQQNARQKKYYARLRTKKINSSEEWDTSLEESQWTI